MCKIGPKDPKPIHLRSTALIKGHLKLLKYHPTQKQNLGHGTFMSQHLGSDTLLLKEKVPPCLYDTETEKVICFNHPEEQGQEHQSLQRTCHALMQSNFIQ